MLLVVCMNLNCHVILIIIRPHVRFVYTHLCVVHVYESHVGGCGGGGGGAMGET